MLARRFQAKSSQHSQQQHQQQLLQRTVMGHLHAWAVQKEKGTLRSVVVQVYGLVVDASPYPDSILEKIWAVAVMRCSPGKRVRWMSMRRGTERDCRGQECQGPRAEDAGVAQVQRLSVAAGCRLVVFQLVFQPGHWPTVSSFHPGRSNEE